MARVSKRGEKITAQSAAGSVGARMFRFEDVKRLLESDRRRMFRFTDVLVFLLRREVRPIEDELVRAADRSKGRIHFRHDGFVELSRGLRNDRPTVKVRMGYNPSTSLGRIWAAIATATTRVSDGEKTVIRPRKRQTMTFGHPVASPVDLRAQEPGKWLSPLVTRKKYFLWWLPHQIRGISFEDFEGSPRRLMTPLGRSKLKRLGRAKFRKLKERFKRNMEKRTQFLYTRSEEVVFEKTIDLDKIKEKAAEVIQDGATKHVVQAMLESIRA